MFHSSMAGYVTTVTLMVTFVIHYTMASSPVTEQYIRYNIDPVGCQYLPRVRSTLQCGSVCLATVNCCAFQKMKNTSNESCYICKTPDITNLSSTDDEHYFVRTHAMWNYPYSSGGTSVSTLSVPGGLSPGMMVIVSATVLQDPVGSHVAVNFASGPSTFIMHFNPRLGVKNIAMDSCNNGVWAQQELFYMDPFPFAVGKITDVQFLVRPEGYLIFTDGRYLGLFQHRLSMASVTYIEAKGYIRVHEISV